MLFLNWRLNLYRANLKPSTWPFISCVYFADAFHLSYVEEQFLFNYVCFLRVRWLYLYSLLQWLVSSMHPLGDINIIFLYNASLHPDIHHCLMFLCMCENYNLKKKLSKFHDSWWHTVEITDFSLFLWIAEICCRELLIIWSRRLSEGWHL